MVAQTNDTDHHAHVRKSFIEKQTELMIRKGRTMGGGMIDLTREENIDIMIEVMSDVNLHLRAARGYKYTGADVALLDDNEDAMICREAGTFWREMNMRKEINTAVADVKQKWDDGLLKWNYKSVRAYLPDYPRKGQLDVPLPGQEDEATPDPDGVPWDPVAGPAAHPALRRPPVRRWRRDRGAAWRAAA